MSTPEQTEEDPFAILGETLENAAKSMDSVEGRARTSAHRAADATKRAVGSGAYSTSYGLAYGAVWIGTYLHDLMPPGGVIQRGFADGAHDALAARILRLAVGEQRAAGHDHDLAEEADVEASPPNPAPRGSSHANGASAKRGRVSSRTRGHVDKMANSFAHKV
jgi:hypothetical protein